MAEATLIQRPQRWDSAFDPDMAEEDVWATPLLQELYALVKGKVRTPT